MFSACAVFGPAKRGESFRGSAPSEHSRAVRAQNREAGETQAVSFPSDTEVLVENGGKAACFSYDAVFDPAVGQAKVFEETQPLVVSVLDGYNVCIFA